MSDSPCNSAFSCLEKHQGIQLLRAALGQDADLHVVGGVLRDIALGRESGDIDLATKLLPEEVQSRLKRAEIRVIPSGLQHQTLIAVPVKGAPGIEITTFRTSGMRPESGRKFANTIEEDLSYRDFTINALAYSLDRQECIDPLGARADIRDTLIRAVGEPEERFAEDPLRVLRMIRFSCMSGFSIEKTTRAASLLFVDTLMDVSVERIRDEFSAILCSDTPSRGLASIRELGILRRLIPELQDCVGFEQNQYHSKPVFEHTLEVVEKTPPELIHRLAALFHDIGKPPTLSVDDKGERHFYCHESVGAEITEEVLRRLRYSKKIVSAVSTLVATHMRPISAGKSGIRRILRDTDPYYDHWRALKEADSTSVRLDSESLRKQMSAFDVRVAEVKEAATSSPYENLVVNGNDILALGIKPGPRVGDVLRMLCEAVLENPENNNRAYLLALAKKELEL